MSLYVDGLVSVIIPAYNCGNHIGESIASVLAQTYKHLELIVVDDCSSDDTFQVAMKVSDGVNWVKIVKSASNGGAGLTRNIGLSLARGQYIAFLDSDDVWCVDKIEIQVLLMRAKNASICHTSYSIVDELGNKLPGGVVASSCVDLVSYMKNTEIGLSTAMVNRVLTGDFVFNDARTRQDTILWLTLLGRGLSSVGVDQVLVRYRIRPGQISRNKFKMLYRTFVVYLGVKEISFLKRIVYYCFYIVNSIYKRVRGAIA